MVLIEIIYPYLVVATLCLVSLSLWSWYVNSLKDKNSKLPLPPGTVGLPFVGETLHMIFQGWKFYKARREKYGRVYKTHILGKPTIRFWGTDNIKKVLKNEEILVTMSLPKSVQVLIGQGVGSSTRKEHSLKRSAVLSTFTNKAMSAYFPIMERTISKYIDKWCEQHDVISTVVECQELVLEVSVRVFLGARLTQDQLRCTASNLSLMIGNLFTLPVNLPGTGYNKAVNARRALLSLIGKVMDQSDTPGQQASVLSHLMQYIESGKYTKIEIQDIILEMFVASYNGIAVLCCSSLIKLARNQQVVADLLEAMKDSNLLKDSDDQILTPESLSNIPYLQSVWKELARTSHPVGGGYRQVLKTFELDGFQIPAGWTLLYDIRDNHTDEENYTSANDFNPNRWDDPTAQESFITFGGKGIRSCVGMKYTVQFISLFLVLLIRKATWRITDTEIEYITFPAPLPKQLSVSFTKRKLN